MPRRGACWPILKRGRWWRTSPANGWRSGAWNRRKPDRERFPDFDEYLRASMLKETELFFQYVMREDRSVLDFIDGPYSFLNERLARHYGIPGVTGIEFRKVDLSGTGRSGILTQASVLEVSSYGNRTSPVLRGKWILDNILNSPASAAACRTCLAWTKMPSVPRRRCGSNWNSIGRMPCAPRAMPGWIRSASVSKTSTPSAHGGLWTGSFRLTLGRASGRPEHFAGADELKIILRQQKDTFAGGLAEKLLTYALGRGLDRSDQPAVKQIVARMAAERLQVLRRCWGLSTALHFRCSGKG